MRLPKSAPGKAFGQHFGLPVRGEVCMRIVVHAPEADALSARPKVLTCTVTSCSADPALRNAISVAPPRGSL
jgi:hypothetical protein